MYNVLSLEKQEAHMELHSEFIKASYMAQVEHDDTEETTSNSVVVTQRMQRYTSIIVLYGR